MKKAFFTLYLAFCVLPAFSQQEELQFDLSKTYPLDTGATVILISKNATVNIVAGLRNDVALKVHYRASAKGLKLGETDFKMEVTQPEGNLQIKEVVTGNQRVIGKLDKEYTIDMQIPAYASLDIRGQDDHYRIKAVRQNMRIAVDDAHIEVYDFAGDELNITADDGEVQVVGGRGKLHLRLDDADLKILKGEFSQIDYRGVDGDIYAENSLLSNTLLKFSGDDNTINLVITRGGGSFRVQYDKSKLEYDRNFRMTNKDRHFTTLALTGSRGKVVIAGDNLKVKLTSPGNK